MTRIEVNNYRKRRVRVHVTEFNNDGLMWAVVRPVSAVPLERSAVFWQEFLYSCSVSQAFRQSLHLGQGLRC